MGLSSKIIVILGLGVLLLLGFGDTASAQVCDLTTLKDEKDATLYPYGNPSWFLPDCVYFEGQDQSIKVKIAGGQEIDVPAQKVCGCRNINVLIQLLINVTNKILMVVGGVALLVFIYGGFLILTAAGGEGVKKGKEALVSAVIGLVVIFSAQLLLNFVLDIVVNKAAGDLKGKATVEGVQIKVPEVK